MSADKRPFTIPETQPMTYVALVLIRNSVAYHVYGNANSWSNFHDQLEDAGLIVVENQTSEWDGDLEAIKDDCIHIQDFLNSDIPVYP
jgi:hypothetical protein